MMTFEEAKANVLCTYDWVIRNFSDWFHNLGKGADEMAHIRVKLGLRIRQEIREEIVACQSLEDVRLLRDRHIKNYAAARDRTLCPLVAAGCEAAATCARLADLMGEKLPI